ncbi:Alpha/Beta hydrolase protein [Dunaliella salina]|uniref:Alpha/Beta hydrolase protein n=1 Tax=Dunaliella salina TaxID=3046 RepID=A0ABQ7FYH0_DUNSA|nr:Alpha/Beta hydrolase protein [Dunaliella salina]|eukprot:KAF5827415.1 Alpha/Beta hydrolase protein [Dunaliella salina]
MAANLAIFQPEVFACAIARTGAYNRTLTPFGFQNEERTLWQAPEVYARMSPFMNADKATRPILLIHGEDDNNPGTFTLQSERFYAALKGHGVTSRLVILPCEAHGYRARESVLHALYEQDQWMERFAGFGRKDPDYTRDT